MGAVVEALTNQNGQSLPPWKKLVGSARWQDTLLLGCKETRWIFGKLPNSEDVRVFLNSTVFCCGLVGTV